MVLPVLLLFGVSGPLLAALLGAGVVAPLLSCSFGEVGVGRVGEQGGWVFWGSEGLVDWVIIGRGKGIGSGGSGSGCSSSLSMFRPLLPVPQSSPIIIYFLLKFV